MIVTGFLGTDDEPGQSWNSMQPADWLYRFLISTLCVIEPALHCCRAWEGKV